jgi:hypothetical protein
VVQWVIAGLLAVIAVGLWLRPAGFLPAEARAQNPPLAGARGVFAFTGQIDRDQYGLFMLDVDQGTVWCYAFEAAGGGVRKLRLVAARTWIYDRYLQDFNCAAPDFREVQALVNQQRGLATGQPEAPRRELDESESGGVAEDR